MTQGPNVKKLIIHRMSWLMIPPGTKEGTALAVGINNLLKPGNLARVCKEATEWVEQAIAVVRTSPDNPYKNDEEIAGEILAKIDEKRREEYKRRGYSDAVIEVLMR